MPRDGSGNYTLPAGNPVVSGTIIDVTWANPTMSDVAAALTDSLSRTGSGGMLVPFLNADGAVGSPGISWVNETTSGLYRAGLNDQRFASSGVDKVQITADPSNPLLVWNVGDASFRPVLDTFSPATILGDWLFQGALTMEGPLVTDDSTTARSGLNVPTGVEPTVPAQGDIWVEAANIFCRLNGVNESLIGSNAVSASGAVDRMLVGDGAGGWEDAGSALTYDGALFRTLGEIQADSVKAMDFGGESLGLFVGATNGTIQVGGGPTYIRTPDTWRFEDDFYLQENGSFGPGVSTFGQLWVDNTTPQGLYFVDEASSIRPIISSVLSFTIDWTVGFSDTNANVYHYSRVGDQVTFWLVTANLGNSNGGAMGAAAGELPSLLRPDTIRYVMMPFVDNASAIVMALVAINADGSIDAFAPDGSTPPDYGDNWTGAGVKGPIAGSTCTYSTVDTLTTG